MLEPGAQHKDGYHAGAKPCRECEAEREEESDRIEPRGEIPGSEPLGQRHQNADDPPGEDDTEESAGEGENERLREELPHDPEAIGADCGPERELPAPAGELGEVEVRDVRAGDDQNEGGGREKQQEGGTRPPGERIGEGHGRDLVSFDVTISLGMLVPQSCGDIRELFGNTLERGSGTKAGESAHHPGREARLHHGGRAKGTGGDRHEDVVLLRKPREWREDSHDAVKAIVHLEEPPDDRAVAPVAALPVFVAQNEDGLGPDGVLPRKERAAQERSHSKDVEKARGDDTGIDSLRNTVAEEGEGHRVILDQGFESRGRASTLLELGDGEGSWLENQKPLGVGVRQGPD